MTIGSLTIVTCVRDEEYMLPSCLARLEFADELVVVVDDRTVDDSKTKAEAAGARVLVATFDGFASLKNVGIDMATSEWVLVVDADERVSTSLASEIRAVEPGDYEGFSVPIVNYFYGHKMQCGGWQETPIRLMRSGAARYQGDLHETLLFRSKSPKIGALASPLHHFSHRSILDNLRKTANFGDVQARELLARGAPDVTSRTLYWTVLRELLYRLVFKRGWRDGTPGVIEGLYQPLSLLAVKARLWELQQDPEIPLLYSQLESDTW